MLCLHIHLNWQIWYDARTSLLKYRRVWLEFLWTENRTFIIWHEGIGLIYTAVWLLLPQKMMWQGKKSGRAWHLLYRTAADLFQTSPSALGSKQLYDYLGKMLLVDLIKHMFRDSNNVAQCVCVYRSRIAPLSHCQCAALSRIAAPCWIALWCALVFLNLLIPTSISDIYCITCISP